MKTKKCLSEIAAKQFVAPEWVALATRRSIIYNPERKINTF
jgi:ribosomal protein L39E